MSDLKALAVRFDERFARMDERFAKMDERFVKMDERFDRLERDMTFMRKTLSDVAVVVQTTADRLVTMSETLADHGRRLERIEAFIASRIN
ncbi:MAG TPA: hypothetical protein VFA20_00395 [Myxococcaceae bacterium]|nr:hypothetical protein [Myxococcaceae bacterium]